MPLEPAGKLELQQRGLHDGAGEARQANDLVDTHRRRTEQIDNGLALGVRRIVQRPGIIVPSGLSHGARVDRANLAARRGALDLGTA